MLRYVGALLLQQLVVVSPSSPATARPSRRVLPPHHPAQRKNQAFLPPPEGDWIQPQQPKRKRRIQQDDDYQDDDYQDDEEDFPMARLRRDLLKDYERGSFPFEQVWSKSNSTNRTGLEVGVGINFHKVFSVDAANSVIDLIVWFREAWTDPRLAWNPEDYGNLTRIWFTIADGGLAGEMTEIWVPDLELWNLETSISESFTNTQASVTHKGEVFWSRPGHLRPVCKFEGLDNFPFDKLSCTMEFGSWIYTGLYIRPVKYGGEGFSIGGSDTAGEAYAEYSLSGVTCEEYVYGAYPHAPEEDYPVLLYEVSFTRSSEPYARGYLVLQILLNLVAFGCFWLPPHIGERMSLAITSFLASVTSELVVAAKLPAASEITWFAKFGLVSMGYASVVLFESAAVIYFYYHTGTDLVPRWVRYLQRRSTHHDADTIKKRQTLVKLHKQEKLLEGYDYDDDDEDDDKNEFDDDDDDDDKNCEINKMNGESSGDTKKNPRETQKSVSFKKEPSVASFRSNLDVSDVSRELRKHQTKSQKTRETKKFHSTLTGSTRKIIKTAMGRDADDFKNTQEMINNMGWQEVSHNLDDFSRVVFPISYAIVMAVFFTSRE